MRILVTGGASQLSQRLAASLHGDHHVRLTERREVAIEATGFDFVRSDLGHDEATNELLKGMDAVIHSGEADPSANESDQLDAAMRCTYNLLWAAAEEGVSRLIYLSSLRILEKYGEGLVVTERWRPIPATDVPTLCYHLGEYVCREFARESKISVVCLRLGDLSWNDGEPGAASSSMLYFDDAAQAVQGALRTPAKPGWSIFHIQSVVPNARYRIEVARESLGYNPAARS